MSLDGSREASLPKLIGLGLVASALFSVTFIANRAISLSGGHWVWSSILRYLFTVTLVGLWLVVRNGHQYLLSVCREFVISFQFWVLTGGIGYGVFYSAICLSAATAPGWVVAATWQLTIIASPLVLLAFGLHPPTKGVLYIAVIFIGVLAVSAEQLVEGVPIAEDAHSALPVVVAAVAYPVGNQILNMARHKPGRDGRLLEDAPTCVFLMSLGALPFLGIFTLIIAPPPPPVRQVVGSLLVAFAAGALATSVFTYARNLSSDPHRIAAVDATQAAEVVFTLAGEVLVLGAPLPGPVGWIGITALIFGLAGLARC